MEYQILRGTGATVSRLCLGTMTFGQQVDEPEAARLLGRALEAGVTFIDTADAYCGGRSEEILGRLLKGKREQIVLASKVCGFSGVDRRRDAGLHRWHVTRGVEASLRRLQTDCLDILYMHHPDRNTPIEETLAAFDALVRQGKVVYVGMSNHASWQVCEALWRAHVHHWAAPVVMQVPYNLLTRSIEEECVAFCTKMNVGMAVYNPLAGGLLTGKHTRQAGPSAGTRFQLNEGYRARFWWDANFEAVARLAGIAAEVGRSLVELSLQWLLSQPHVDAVILGASRLGQLEENLAAAQGRLSAETLAACDAVWKQLRGPHFAYNR
ncbi:MAG: aldo/keto reductase [Candidatus Latescibacterota bacterium]